MDRRFCTAAGAMFVGALLLATGPAVRAQSRPSLTVRLYNTAHLPPAQLLMARDAADAILRDASVDARFRMCAAGGTDPCDTPLKESEVVVRIIDAPAFNATLDPEAYGVTYVVNATNRGWLATVFADRITAAASRVDVDPGILVGRVMAHEIGHLLLGRDYHGAAGLMQASWTDDMLTRPADAWRFTVPEAARLRQIRSLLQ